MDPEMCETCGLRWGGIGSHPPCLELPKDERRDLVAAALSRSAPDEDGAEGGRSSTVAAPVERAHSEEIADRGTASDLGSPGPASGARSR